MADDDGAAGGESTRVPDEGGPGSGEAPESREIGAESGEGGPQSGARAKHSGGKRHAPSHHDAAPLAEEAAHETPPLADGAAQETPPAADEAARETPPPADHRPRWRGIVAIILVVVATLLAPLTLAVAWMDHDLLNTQNYVTTVAPLSSDPAVQTALAHDVTNQIWSRVNVQQQLTGVLPSWAQVFAAPLSNTLKGYTYQATQAIVSSPAFSQVWRAANEKGHATVKAALLGNQGGVVQTTNGQVTLDLAPLADKVKAALDARGIHVLDSVTIAPGTATFVVFRSQTLAKAQKVVKFFQALRIALPLLLIAAWAGAIAVSTRRRRTVLELGFALALAMAVTLIGYHLGRTAYLNAVSSPQLPRDAATSIFDTLLVGLLDAARTVFVVGLVIGIAALLLGPARWAVRLRDALSGGFRSAGARAEEKGLDLGPVGGWVAAHHRALQIVGLVVAAAVLVFWGTPGVAGVLWTVVVLLIYLAVVEFVGRLTKPASEGADPA